MPLHRGGLSKGEWTSSGSPNGILCTTHSQHLSHYIINTVLCSCHPPPPFTPELCSLHPGGGVRQGRLDVSLTGMKEREKALWMCLTGDADCDVRDGSSPSIWHLCGDLCLGRRRLGEGGRIRIPRERIFYWIPEMGRSLHIRERERRPGWPEFSKKMV